MMSIRASSISFMGLLDVAQGGFKVTADLPFSSATLLFSKMSRSYFVLMFFRLWDTLSICTKPMFNSVVSSSKKDEIRESVVLPIPINVMDLLKRLKIASEAFFHHKAMLKVGATMCLRVIRGVKPNVTIPVNSSATFPAWMIFPFWVHLWPLATQDDPE